MLTDTQAFVWRQRLRTERALRNITDTHVRILEYTAGLIEAGDAEPRQADVAVALGYGVRTVGDAYRRAKGLRLLDWQAQFRAVSGVRRRTVNRYWLTMPDVTPAPRPDLRRHRKTRRVFLSMPSCSAHSAEPLRGFEERFAAKIAEEKRARLRRVGFQLSAKAKATSTRGAIRIGA